MKKISLIFGLLFVATVCCSIKAQNPPPSHFEGTFELLIRFSLVEIQPEMEHPRNPIEAPQIGQTDHTLYFLDGTALVLNIYSVAAGGDETLEYTTAVSATTTEVQLPSTLSGSYIIEIVRDGLYFRGEIEL
jgi:hypothetical protein